MEIANNPDLYIRWLRSRLLGGIWSLHPAGLQGYGLQLLASEAFTLNVEYRGVIKYSVQRTQQGIVLIEVTSPVRGMLVAGKYNIEVAFLVVSPVNQIEEQPGILFIELTVPHLVNNQTGRTHQTIEHRGFLASSSGSGELVPQLRHLNEIGLYSSLATRIAKSLRKMCLAGSSRTNERQIPVGIDGRQGR